MKKKVKSLIWSLKKADSEFSLWIRDRDKVCQRCGGTNYLTCSHYWVRQHKATRFDPENCVAVCWMPCHKYYWEKEKQGDYMQFMIRRLGKKKYDELEKKYRTIVPQSKAIIDCMSLLKKKTKK